MRIRTVLIATILAFLVILTGCNTQNGEYSVTGGGSADGDVLIAGGKLVSERTEVGITAVFFNVEDDHYTPAVGPYAAYLVPLPADVQEDWQPYLGGAILMETEDFGFMPKVFGGVIYKPEDVLSPVYMVEKSFPSGDISTPDIADRDDVYHWFNLRYRF